MFKGENQQFLEQVSARRWEQDYIPPWAKEKQEERSRGGQGRKCPQGGFYNGCQDDPNWKMGMLLLASFFLLKPVADPLNV